MVHMTKQISFSSSKYSASKIAEFFKRAGVLAKTTKDGPSWASVGNNRYIKHIWSGGKHYFWIPDYLDENKVKKYAQGYATGAFKLPPPLQKMRYEQPFDTRQPQVPAKTPEGEYIYETFVNKKEQVADIQNWAQERGARAERMYAISEAQAKEFAEKGIGVRILSKEQLPEQLELQVTAPEKIQYEKSEQLGKIAGRQVYEESGGIEKALLHLQTVLSPKGYEYVGAAARESVASRPTDLTALATKGAIDLVFPNIKTTEDVVVENVSERIARHSRGEYSYSYDLPVVGRLDIPEQIVEAVANPVVDVEFMALGGTGVAKLGATKLGAKVLASTAGKAVAAAGAAGFAAQRGYEVYTLRQKGESTKALGLSITTVTGVAAGIVGFKLQSSYMANQAVKEIKLDASKIKGASITEQKGQVSVSKGKFEITEGKLKGLKGTVYSQTEGKEGAKIIDIPEQKVGSLKVPAQQYLRHTSEGTAIKTSLGKISVVTSKEGRIVIDIGTGKTVKGPLVGAEADKTYIRETARIIKPGTDSTGKSSNFLIRKLEGLGIGKTAGKYKVYLVQRGSQTVLIESKALTTNLRLAKIDWVDISKVAGGGAGVQVYGSSGASYVKPGAGVSVVPKVTSAAVPTQLAVKVQPAVGVRIVPNVNPTPTGVRIKETPASKKDTQTVVINTPMIIRKEEGKTQGRTVSPGTVVAVQVPQIERALESARTNYTPIASTYHPITGQKVTEKEATLITQKLEPIIDRIASQPVPVVPVTTNKPGGLVIPSLVPFIRLSRGGGNLKKFSTGALRNPVPDIEKVI